MVDNIDEVAKLIEKNGGRLYLVGGAVRDKLLRRAIHDEDYCVVGLETTDFERIFPDVQKRGKAFPVYSMLGREFAMARAESKNGKKHTDFNIETNKNITILQDLKRRDITINSIAQDVLTGDIIDPYKRTAGFKRWYY